MKTILFSLLNLIAVCANAQYLGVKARYAQSRLVNNAPEPPSRENRLILSFFHVDASGVFTPATLSNYDIWIYKNGFQYGSESGGVLDSNGNNYGGYTYTAPRVVAYHNSWNANAIDCDPTITTQYTVNGHELDCGFVQVSYWESGGGEVFTAPNVCLPYYTWPDPYAMSPGNVNFIQPIPATPPYNFYNFSCPSSGLQYVVRGVLPLDSFSENSPLPVKFANVKGEIDANNKVNISWSNLTESSVSQYEVERSDATSSFQMIGLVFPLLNNGDRADYSFPSIQAAKTAFYRIKAIENSGKISYSTVISLTTSDRSEQNENVLAVYPNPVTDDVVQFRMLNAEAGRYTALIVGPDGKHIKQRLIDHPGGDLIRQIEVPGLLPGIYQLVLKTANTKYTSRFFYVY